ncbi:MAG: hypothetical protein HFE57_13740 [Firmicutes bacterium]|jgi:hypothetical protein|nr:hypothetical protein [Bacillota bacterium]
MIDFKQELSKYQPILELERIEDSIHNSEVQDILDILQHLSKAANYSQNQQNQTVSNRPTQNR